jgi:two-component system cell cycle response regulator
MPDKEKKPSILCIDDDFNNLSLLEAVLAPRGYRIILADCGQAAFEKIAEELPDLILLDVMMPRMSGFEVLEKLRADEKTRAIPVVMITALRDTEDRVKAIEAGCDDFISKPFDKNELLARARSLLRIKSLHDKLQSLNELLQKLSVTDPLTDLYNRRYLVDKIQIEIRRMHTSKGACSCLIIDVDHFKQINDKYGHSFGDEVLKYLARSLRESVRVIDIVARYGGDEFFVLAPDADEQGARAIENNILRKIEAGYIKYGDANIPVRVSVGISTFHGEEAGKEILDAALLGKLMDKLVNDADKSLYILKNSKKSQATIHKPCASP